MKDHHTITEKMYRDATKSHPYTSRHLDNRIVVIQSKHTKISSADQGIGLHYFFLYSRGEE